MPTPRILSFGSVNIDHVYSVDDFNKAGETKAAKAYQKLAGGKGANQSVAIAKAGATCLHAGKIGPDGEWVQELMTQAGVDCKHLIIDPNTATGTAIIQVSEVTKQNSILIWAGGNAALTCPEVDEVFCLQEEQKWCTNDWLVVQNELSLTPYIIQRASEYNMKVIYNPAPMDACLIKEIPWDKIDVLIVNETEAMELLKLLGGDTEAFPSEAELFSVENWTDLATKLSNANQLSKGIRWIIVTLGSKGSLALQTRIDGISFYSSCAKPPAPIQDTTGAGDTFLGFLVSHLSLHCSTEDGDISPEIMQGAIKLAASAAALAVTQSGAMASIPSIDEVTKSFPKSFSKPNSEAS